MKLRTTEQQPALNALLAILLVKQELYIAPNAMLVTSARKGELRALPVVKGRTLHHQEPLRVDLVLLVPYPARDQETVPIVPLGTTALARTAIRATTVDMPDGPQPPVPYALRARIVRI